MLDIHAEMYSPYITPEMRTIVQERNRGILTQVAKPTIDQIQFQPNQPLTIDLPGLLCNEVYNPNTPPSRQGFRLECEIVPHDLSLKIKDPEGKEIANNHSRYTFPSNDVVEITPSTSTTLGYEGNGYGSALFSLADPLIIKAMKLFGLDKTMRWIYVTAEAGAEGRRSTVLRSRNGIGWSATMAGQNGYTNDSALLERYLSNPKRYGPNTFIKIFQDTDKGIYI